MIDKYVLKRLFSKGRLRNVMTQRLTEPLHLNFLSAAVALFGSFRLKVDFDLVIRQQYAFPILRAADWAKENGFSRVTVVEFGVASGAGLLNMCRIAAQATRATGVAFQVVGFDTGKGMPKPLDYRDHPESFREGDFPMDQEALAKALPSFARLIIGNVGETVGPFLASLPKEAPIGFVALDLDYYSSSKCALSIFGGPWEKYLPVVALYLDDIALESFNPWAGELLAVREFNETNALRKIAPFTMLRPKRIFKNAQWIDQMFAVHIHDHARRSPQPSVGERRIISNAYIETRLKA